MHISVNFVGMMLLLRCRSYYPETGRFISTDIIEVALDSGEYNLYAYCGNDPINNIDPTGYFRWKTFWKGVGRVTVGVAATVAAVAVFASGVAPVAMLVVGGVTAVVGAATIINGVADIGEAASDYNFMKDGLFQGNEKAYDIYAGVTQGIATVGSMICGGWLKFNQPRISAYKNVGNYKFSGSLTRPDHMSRSYQQSTLLQKQVIKYGKMVNEGKGTHRFLMPGTYSIGAGHVHSVTWKLIVNIAKRTIWHMGPF